MKENGGCLHRICGSPGDVFYAVCGSSTGNVAVGGADRTVTIFDPRREFLFCMLEYKLLSPMLHLVAQKMDEQKL
nr:hypothetical protein CFP56_22954 [Quercus suber]